MIDRIVSIDGKIGIGHGTLANPTWFSRQQEIV